MYLLRNNGQFELIEEKEVMLRRLRAITFEWCDSPSYVGKDFESLYQECLTNKNFGDIAEVYKITNLKKPSDRFPFAYGRKVGDTFKMERIY